MSTTCLFPGRYLQGPDALAELPREVSRLGGRAALLCDDFAATKLGGRLNGLLADEILVGITYGGANSEIQAARHAAKVQAAGGGLVIGVGGGKALDTAKALAELALCHLILVPTAASSDAPCSSVAVMQAYDGSFSHDRFLRRSPDLVLVDTLLIASAPPRMLAAGIGDALSTWFEAEESRTQGWLNIGGSLPSAFAMLAARQCLETVFKHGARALQELRDGAPGEAFERIVEANILLSGIGFESGGLGTAHAIQNGLNGLPQCRGVLHGELVTIGLLAMLRLPGADPSTFAQVHAFASEIGLPVRLTQIGLGDASDETLLAATRFACTPAPMNRVASGISAEQILAALRCLA